MAPAVLIFCEIRDGALRSASLPAITFGREMAAARNADLVLLLIGPSTATASTEAARLGAKRVVTVEDARLTNYLAETYAPVIARIAREQTAQVVAATATNLGKDLMPRVAAQLDCGMASDVMAVLGPQRFRRPMMAGNVLAEVEVTTPTVVATVRQTEFSAPAPVDAAAEIVRAETGEVNDLGVVFVGLQETKSERPELTDARIVVAGGRGMRSGENFGVLEQLCDELGAALGASRAACDAGFVPNDLQVGQTGKVVAPDLYIAVAISGAIQHLAGMKGSKVIVAVNKDGEAPIFQVADYGLVASWEKAVPELTEEIKKLKAAHR